jgi:methyl-accepting chemotaxis protein
MSSAIIQPLPEESTQTGDDIFAVWRNVISPSLTTLRSVASTTEDEFLQIGSQMQSFYQRSVDISRMANQLVDAVSGDRLQVLIGRLQQMLQNMESYLADSRSRSSESRTTLERVQELLEAVTQPLQGFQKMNKTLRMLSISTKIESSRLGELGSGFVNLAMDVEKLSHQVNDKSAAILAQRQSLASKIVSDLAAVHAGEKVQDSELQVSLAATADNLHELISANDRCTRFGSMASSVSAEVIANIGEVVASQQTHDITRQQIEHVIEALERLTFDLNTVDDERRKKQVVEVGDVCELQEAQLRFATTELYTAVCTIVENLRDVADKQSAIAQETLSVVGVAAGGGSSFVDAIKEGIMSVTTMLNGCAKTDHDMAGTMRDVTGTIQQITSFVSDIEYIGTEIDLIALNSQIKAALTGPEGAALGVLAEAIKRLSDEAVKQTGLVSATLNNIHAATDHLSTETDTGESSSAEVIESMEHELSEILNTLGVMNSDLFSLLTVLVKDVQSLTYDIEQATGGIDVHERIKEMTTGVLADLERIVRQARQIEPASNEFKQNLLHMEQRYTMESERHIHEAIARKRNGQPAEIERADAMNTLDSGSDFGDNVDLF